MILYKTAADLTNYLITKCGPGYSIGFVPTMGALHAGHLSLVEKSKQQMALTVASIFVNPTQFNDPGDFSKYPVTIEKDILHLEKAGCDVLFLPAVKEIYPNGTVGLPDFNLGYLETILEGKYRPGHFQGVCQVMSRLLEISMPQKLFMGQKDYQQCMVIRQLIRLKGWNTELLMMPTLREPSGLAMSSRNMRLSETDRLKASVIFRALQYLQETIKPGDLSVCIRKARAMIEEAGFEKIDYVSIADANSLQPVVHWNGYTPLVVLAAAFINGVRLIDNRALQPDEKNVN